MYVETCRKSAYLLMAVIVFAAPLAACAMPWMVLSEAEEECCHHMADQCGSSNMQQSHTCCTKLPKVTASTLQPTAKHWVLPDYAIHAAVFPAPSLRPCVAVTPADYLGRCESPPGHVSVLRI
jgi:hypothetical protein